MIRNHSPDGPGNGDRKRRRKVLSCYDCRRRKLQCDRGFPACGRCVKTGQSDNCLYLDDANEATPSKPDHSGVRSDNTSVQDVNNTTPGLSHDSTSRADYQERRIKQLEAALLEADKKLQASEPLLRSRSALRLPPTPESLTGHASSILQNIENGTHVNDRETMLLRGGSFKTQFLGGTHPSGLLAHLNDLNSFTREAFKTYPALKRIRADMKALDQRQHLAMNYVSHSLDPDLKTFLPSKSVADGLLQIYFDNYGLLYNVIHAPSFWREYNAIWADLTLARPAFIVLVLLLIAAAQCLDISTSPIYTANSSIARDKAVRSIVACENWLRDQSQKHTAVTDFQIRFLLLLGKQTSARKYKRVWTETGEFLRFCMSAGLHRNPELLRKDTTALDRELRRRLWAAAVELELQAAFDRGMVPQNWPVQSDAAPPGHYHDDQLEVTGDTLPAAKPVHELTVSSHLAMAGESLMLRHQLTTALNNIRQHLSFDEIKRFTDELQHHLDHIPTWTGANAKVPIAKLELMLRQYMLALHDRQVRQAETRSERSFSRLILIDTATRVVNTHRALLNHGCHALQLFCQDQVRAALSICHVGATVDLYADITISQVIETQAHKLLDDIIEMLTDKSIRFGRERRQLWTALAAYAWWKAKMAPSKRTQFMAEAVDKIVQPYYKMLACQENHDVLDARLADPRPSQDPGHGIFDYIRPAATSSTAIPTTSVAIDMLDTTDTMEGNDPALLDLDEIAAWTFEDWTFTPADFQQAFGSAV